MGQAMDFEKARKKRRRAQLLKRIAALLLVFATVYAVLSINDMLVSDNFITRMRDFMSGLGGEGYPIPVPGGVLKDVKALSRDIAVLNDTNLYIYNNKGKETLNIPRMTESSVALTAGSRVLTYDVGGTKYRLHTRANLLLEAESEHPLSSMALGERGDYAVISSSKQYTTQVTVFDPKHEMAFQWSSGELVTAVALHPKGGRMAAACVGARDGELRSSVALFSFDTDHETARVEFPDELLLQLVYLEENRIGVLTDRGYHVIDENGKLIAGYGFGGEHLVSARFAGGEALILSEAVETRSQTLLLFDAEGKKLGSLSPEKTVRDMQLGSGACILTDDGIILCDKTLAVKETVEISGVGRILIAADTIYCFTGEEIHVLDARPGG